MITKTANQTRFNLNQRDSQKNKLILVWMTAAILMLSGQKAIATNPNPESENNNSTAIDTHAQAIRPPQAKLIPVSKDFELHLGNPETPPTPETEDNDSTIIRTNPEPVLAPQAKLLPVLKNYELHLGKPETPGAIASGVRLVLRLSERRVYVYEEDQEIASYPVAIGKEGWETPTGNFEVIQAIEDPQWQNPWTGEVMPAGPDTALGLRWIGFWSDGENTIGFHGTPTVDSIGYAASHGCVRMYNEDVVALIEKVQLGTPVVVEP